MMSADKQALVELANGIAKHLPDTWDHAIAGFATGWRYEPHDDHWVMTVRHPDGPALLVGEASVRGRVRISGEYPRGPAGYYSPWGKGDRVEITVAASRGPQAIAREIHRRLMVKYLEQWLLATERRDRDQANLDAATKLHRALHKVAGTTPYRDDYQATMNHERAVSVGDHAYFKVSGTGAVTVEIRADIEDHDLVLDLARWIRARERKTA